MARAAGAVAALGFHAVLARGLGPSGYGIFSHVVAVTHLLVPVATLGAPIALTRFLAEYSAKEDWGRFRGSLLHSAIVCVVGSLAVAGALSVLSQFAGIAPGFRLEAKLSAALIAPVTAILFLRKGFQGLGAPLRSVAVPELFVPIVALGLLLTVHRQAVAAAIHIYIASMFAVAIAGGISFWRAVPEPGRTARPTMEPRYWIAIAIPMVLGGLSQLALNRTDIVMLGLMSPMSEVGMYTAASKIAIVLTLVLGAVNAAVSAPLAASYHRGERQVFEGILKRSMAFSGLAAVPLFVVMMAIPAQLLALFGQPYAVGTALLRILAVGQFLNAATGSAGLALLLTGRERLFAITMVILAAANILGNAVAIPLFGAVGAAAVTATSVAVLNVWHFSIVRGEARKA